MTELCHWPGPDGFEFRLLRHSLILLNFIGCGVFLAASIPFLRRRFPPVIRVAYCLLGALMMSWTLDVVFALGGGSNRRMWDSLTAGVYVGGIANVAYFALYVLTKHRGEVREPRSGGAT